MRNIKEVVQKLKDKYNTNDPYKICDELDIWVYKEEYDPEHSPKYKNNRFVPVVQIDKDGKCIATYFNSREAERQTGILHQNIGRCCNSKHTTAGGYFWRKLEDYDPNEVFPTKKQ